jgi:hypothetical protein
MDARRADEPRSVNVRGTDTVLGTAHRLGLDPIIDVSSELALLPSGRGRGPDCRLAGQAAVVAVLPVQGGFRAGGPPVSAAGAPVVSVMPATLWGPHDPHFGESVTRAANVLKGRYPIVMRGGMHIADVRDVAAGVAAVMTPGRGARSYMVAGTTSRCPTSSAPSPTSPVVASASPRCRRGCWAGSAARPTSCNGASGRDCRGMPRGSGFMNAPPVATTQRRAASSRLSRGPFGKRWSTPSAGWSRSAASAHARRAGSPTARWADEHGCARHLNRATRSKRALTRRAASPRRATCGSRSRARPLAPWRRGRPS